MKPVKRRFSLIHLRIFDSSQICLSEFCFILGIYIFPWDRNNASYGILDADGSAPYVKNILRKQIEECLTKYGDIFEIWFDGANGGDGYYGGIHFMDASINGLQQGQRIGKYVLSDYFR